MVEVIKELTKDRASLSISDIFLIAVATPMVNGLVKSVLGDRKGLNSVVKIGAGTMIGTGGTFKKVLASSMIISGVNDLTSSFLPNLSGKKESSGVSVVGGNNANQGILPGAVI